jgi:hypothetical protein
MSEVYVERAGDGSYDLRQKCYKVFRTECQEHPLDLLAVCRDLQCMRTLTNKHWPDADYGDILASKARGTF